MITLEQIRCPVCNRRLVDLAGQAQIRCPKCKALVDIDTVARKVNIRERQEKSANYPKVG